MEGQPPLLRSIGEASPGVVEYRCHFGGRGLPFFPAQLGGGAEGGKRGKGAAVGVVALKCAISSYHWDSTVRVKKETGRLLTGGVGGGWCLGGVSMWEVIAVGKGGSVTRDRGGTALKSREKNFNTGSSLKFVLLIKGVYGEC